MLGKILRSLQFWKLFSKNLTIGLSLLMLFVAAITVDSTQLLKRGPNAASAQEYEYYGSEDEGFWADYQSSYNTSGSGYEYYSYSSESSDTYVSNDSSNYNYGYEYVSSTPYDSSYSSDYSSSYNSSGDYQYYGSQPYANYETSSNINYGYEYGGSTPYGSNTSSAQNYGYEYGGSTSYDSSPSYTEGPGCNGTHAVWGKWNGSQLIEVEADYGETGECGYSSSGSSSSGTSYSGSTSSASSSSGSWQFIYPECDWNSGKVYDVYWHSGTGEYDRRNYHYQDGVCGYSERSSTSTGSTTQTSQSGSWQFVYPECDWNSGQVYDVYWHSGTGAYERRNPHYQEDACGRDREWEGPGCNGNRSVWGVWDNSNRNRLIRVERDYGVVPGECNNPYPTATPTPTPSAYITSERQECNGRRLVVRRYWSDNRSPQVITDYGELVGYCGVQYHAAPVQQPVYAAPQPVYSAPQPVYTAPVSQPVVYTTPPSSLTPIQAACTADVTSITRGQSVTYTAYVSTGGTGRVGRADFRGERSQSSGNPNFTVRYDTSGIKYMTVNVTDADRRGGSQLVECPWITVYDPVVQGAQSTGGYPIYTQPPVYGGAPQQPVYYQQPTVVYSNNPVPAPNTQPVYTGTPSGTYVTPAQNTDYCPAGYTQQLSGGYVYCIAQQPSTTTTPAATSAPSTSSINCPAGYTAQTYGTSVYCVAQSGGSASSPSTTAPLTTVAPAQSQPQVTYKTADAVGELPRTGLPLAAWGVSALLPLGLKLRKSKKVNDETSANSIWTSRQLEKEN